jgi:hypothetical protein
MSKRMRGSARAHRRPGARPPSNRPATARPTRPVPAQSETSADGLTTLEVAPVLTDEMAHETASNEVVPERRTAMRSAHARVRAKPGSVLAARAATEYVYVGQDLRRIVIVSALLVGLMIAAWLLIVVLQVIPLDFY